jgi:ribulose 1,5-bisphosphate carboxylase large subunit-like protein
MIQARDEAIEVTGEPKWYIANLLCEPNELPERFELAVELGVNAVLVAPFIQGLGVLPWLARQKRLPILAHNSGSDLLTRNPEWGISHETAASWLRSLGADWVVTPGGFASSDQPDDEEKTFIDACTRSQSIRPTMPILQGGKEPAGLCGYTRSVGNSAYMLIVASWIDRHEEGMMRGAQYFRRAVDHSGGKEG